MADRDSTNTITPRTGGPLLAPNRPNHTVAHVNNIDWSDAPIATLWGVSGETKGGPGVTWGRNVRKRVA